MDNQATATATSSSSAASQTAPASLTPSQAMKSSSQQQKQSRQPKESKNNSSSNNNSSGNKPSEQKSSSAEQQQPSSGQAGNNKKQNNRRPRKKQNNNNNNNRTSPQRNQGDSDDANKYIDNGNGNGNRNNNNNKRNNNRGGRNSNNNNQGNQQNNNNNSKNRNRKRGGRKKYPWRRFIPDGSVDPITLEDLKSLPYPPFALVASEPYTPVPVWPIPENNNKNSEEEKKLEPKVDIEEINRRRLQEQWGQSLIKSDGAAATETDEKQQASNPVDPAKRHYHLYDGRALAYYIVSQQQFIDPLNRRDLTRPELANLDDYLRRHGFRDLKVTEAYDAKGITLSSAGAAAATAQGRADILQQMASNLLDALFGGQSVRAPNPSRNSNDNNNRRSPPRQQQTEEETTTVQEQYAALQRQEAESARQREQTHNNRGLNPNATPFGGGSAASFGEAAVYGSEDYGLMVIDDDENPGFRGGNYTAESTNANTNTNRPGPGPASGSGGNMLYSGGHIAQRHGAWAAPSAANSAVAFPALPAAPKPAPAPAKKSAVVSIGKNSTLRPQAKKPSKTLAKISGAVKKTNPEEVQRQWEAREEARKRAMLSNLSFGVDAAAIDMLQQQPQNSAKGAPPGFSQAQAGPSDEKLARNQAFAEALGVKPATVRNPLNSGWARPTDGKISVDEYGNELNAAMYPDSLIVGARERMVLLQKLEKKWKTFLADDSAASMPLNRMDRPTRAMVHEYAEFWKLRTESFDPEPNRYIHCVKTLDTAAPTPLLSVVARNWKGPSAPAYVPPPAQTAPIPPAQSLPSSSDNAASQQAAGQSSNERFGALLENRERPKLELTKRTLPLELPPFQQQQQQQQEAAFNIAEEMQKSELRRQERAKKEREAAEQKRRALEDAFASDDDDDDDDDDDGKKKKSGGGGGNRTAWDSDSDWEEPQAVYDGSDDDEE